MATVRTPFSTEGTNTRSTSLPTSDSVNTTPLSRDPGRDPHPHLRELPGAAGLLLVAVAGLGPAADRLAVGDAGLLQLDGDAEPARQPLDDHLQVDLALAGHDRLVHLVVHPGAEGGVLLLERRQADRELVLVALGAQPEGDVDVGMGVLHLGQLDDEAGAAERVARVGVAQLDDGADVARLERRDRDPLAAVQHVELAEALVDLAGPVEELLAGADAPGVDPEEGHLARRPARSSS